MKYKIGQVWKDRKGSHIKILDIHNNKMLTSVDDSWYLEYEDGVPPYGYADHELVVLMQGNEE